jgi:hypothetical protein
VKHHVAHVAHVAHGDATTEPTLLLAAASLGALHKHTPTLQATSACRPEQQQPAWEQQDRLRSAR